MSSRRKMDLYGLESFCTSLQVIFAKNGKNLQSRDLASYGIFGMAYYIIFMSLLPPAAAFFPNIIVPLCLNHPPPKEFCLLFCHASYGAASSYSRDFCLEARRKSTHIRLCSSVSPRPPSCFCCTRATKNSRFCQAHGNNSTAWSRRESSSTGSCPCCSSSGSGTSRP